MRSLLLLSGAIDAVIEGIGRFVKWIVLAMILIGFLNVVLRYVGRYLGRSLTSNAFIETQWYMFSILFFLGFAYILKANLNVRVDFLYTKWGPKRRAWIDLIGTLLFLIPFCILGIYVTINPVLFSWGHLPGGGWGTWEDSPDPGGLPRAPIKTMIIVAFVLLLIQSISQSIKYVAVLTNTLASEDAKVVEEYHQPAVE